MKRDGMWVGENKVVFGWKVVDKGRGEMGEMWGKMVGRGDLFVVVWME